MSSNSISSTSSFSPLALGDTGGTVALAQSYLTTLGYVGAFASGTFDAATVDQLTQFQTDRAESDDIVPTGVLDEDTWNVLKAAAKQASGSSKNKKLQLSGTIAFGGQKAEAECTLNFSQGSDTTTPVAVGPQVSGAVLFDDGSPADSCPVVALIKRYIDSDRTVLARTNTGSDGRYTLKLPAKPSQGSPFAFTVALYDPSSVPSTGTDLGSTARLIKESRPYRNVKGPIVLDWTVQAPADEQRSEYGRVSGRVQGAYQSLFAAQIKAIGEAKAAITTAQMTTALLSTMTTNDAEAARLTAAGTIADAVLAKITNRPSNWSTVWITGSIDHDSLSMAVISSVKRLLAASTPPTVATVLVQIQNDIGMLLEREFVTRLLANDDALRAVADSTGLTMALVQRFAQSSVQRTNYLLAQQSAPSGDAEGLAGSAFYALTAASDGNIFQLSTTDAAGIAAILDAAANSRRIGPIETADADHFSAAVVLWFRSLVVRPDGPMPTTAISTILSDSARRAAFVNAWLTRNSSEQLHDFWQRISSAISISGEPTGRADLLARRLRSAMELHVHTANDALTTALLGAAPPSRSGHYLDRVFQLGITALTAAVKSSTPSLTDAQAMTEARRVDRALELAYPGPSLLAKFMQDNAAGSSKCQVTVVLGGPLAAGDQLALIVGTTTYSYTIVSADLAGTDGTAQLANVARKMAQLAELDPTFETSTQGASVVLTALVPGLAANAVTVSANWTTDTGGTDAAANVQSTPGVAPSAAIARTWAAGFEGTHAAGDVCSISLDGDTAEIPLTGDESSWTEIGQSLWAAAAGLSSADLFTGVAADSQLTLTAATPGSAVNAVNVAVQFSPSAPSTLAVSVSGPQGGTDAVESVDATPHVITINFSGVPRETDSLTLVFDDGVAQQTATVTAGSTPGTLSELVDRLISGLPTTWVGEHALFSAGQPTSGQLVLTANQVGHLSSPPTVTAPTSSNLPGVEVTEVLGTDTTPQTITIAITGPLRGGDLVLLTSVGGFCPSLTASDGQSLADFVIALKNALPLGMTAGFTATIAEDNAILLTANANGARETLGMHGFTTCASLGSAVAPPTPGQDAVTGHSAAPSTATIDITGTFRPGDAFSVTIDGTEVSTSVTGAMQNLDDLASALAANVTRQDNAGTGGFRAAATGGGSIALTAILAGSAANSIVITGGATVVPRSSATVTPSGVLGTDLGATNAGTKLSRTFALSGSVIPNNRVALSIAGATYSYTVASTDTTMASVAQALAAAASANGGNSQFVVSSSGTNLVVEARDVGDSLNSTAIGVTWPRNGNNTATVTRTSGSAFTVQAGSADVTTALRHVFAARPTGIAFDGFDARSSFLGPDFTSSAIAVQINDLAKKGLAAWTRLGALTPHYVEVESLRLAGVTTSIQITKLGADYLGDAFSTFSLNANRVLVETEVATAVADIVAKARLTAGTIMTSIETFRNHVAEFAISKNGSPDKLSASDPATPGGPYSLFGEQGSCECGTCKSIHGPAAYFADLLQELKAAGPKGHLDRPFAKLVERRPDLTSLLLSCENTTSTLPYIDLVNELLAQRLLVMQSVSVTVPTQTTGTDAELAAYPQDFLSSSQRAQLYSALDASAFGMPAALPFNEPLEEARVYLKQLGTTAQELVELGGESLDSANVGTRAAQERLGVSPGAWTELTSQPASGATQAAWQYAAASGTYTIGVRDAMRRTGRGFDEIMSFPALRSLTMTPCDAATIALVGLNNCVIDTGSKLVVTATSAAVAARVYSRLWRVLRLQSWLGWPLRDVDGILTAFGTNAIDGSGQSDGNVSFASTFLQTLGYAKAFATSMGLDPVDVAYWAAGKFDDASSLKAGTQPSDPAQLSAWTAAWENSRYAATVVAKLPPQLRADILPSAVSNNVFAGSATAVPQSLASALGVSQIEFDVVSKLVAPTVSSGWTLDIVAKAARAIGVGRALDLSVSDLVHVDCLLGLNLGGNFDCAKLSVAQRFLSEVAQVGATVPGIAALLGSPTVSEADQKALATSRDTALGTLRQTLRAAAVALGPDELGRKLADFLSSFTSPPAATSSAAAKAIAAAIFDRATTAWTVTLDVRFPTGALPTGTLWNGFSYGLIAGSTTQWFLKYQVSPVDQAPANVLTIGQTADLVSAISALVDDSGNHVAEKNAAIAAVQQLAEMSWDGKVARALQGIPPEVITQLRNAAAMPDPTGVENEFHTIIGEWLRTSPIQSAAALLLYCDSAEFRRQVSLCLSTLTNAPIRVPSSTIATTLLPSIHVSSTSSDAAVSNLLPFVVSNDSQLPAGAAAARSAFGRIDAVVQLIEQFGLNADETPAFLSASPQPLGAADFDFNALLPTTAASPASVVAAWRRRVQVRGLLRSASTSTFSTAQLLSASAIDGDVFGWRPDDWAYLSAKMPNSGGAAIAVDWVLAAARYLRLCARLAVGAETAWSWQMLDGQSVSAPDAVKTLVAAVRATVGDAEWLRLGPQLRASLRERFRDAMVAYIVGHRRQNTTNPTNPDWALDPNDLYGELLIDVEMGAEQKTSRLVQATATVQLYVQRAKLGLQAADGAPAIDDSWVQVRWPRIGTYRVWEADRKIFLYPENWLEPELRAGKSPLFKKLEKDLAQSDLSSDAIEDVFEAYLNGLSEVANLEIAALHENSNNGRTTQYMIGRSRTTPRVYYARQAIDRRAWSAWERVPVDVDADQVLPLVFAGRLHLFWPVFVAGRADGASATDASSAACTTNGIKPAALENGLTSPTLQLAWTELRLSGWTSRRISQEVTWEADAESDTKPAQQFDTFRRGASLAATVIDGVGVQIGVFSASSSGQSTSKFTFAFDGLSFMIPTAEASDQLVSKPELITGVPYSGHLTAQSWFVSLQETDPATMTQYWTDDLYGGQGTPHVPIGIAGSESPALVLNMSQRSDAGDTAGESAPLVVLDARSRPILAVPTTTSVVKAHGGYGHFPHDGQLSIVDYSLRPLWIPSTTRIRSELATRSPWSALNLKFQTTAEIKNWYTDHYFVKDPARVDATRLDGGIDFDASGPNSVYFWEVFFHVPLLVVNRLVEDQQFEEALNWLQVILNPVNLLAGAADPDGPSNSWQTRPLREYANADKSVAWFLALLELHSKMTEQQAKETTAVQEAQDAISAWLDHPFDPHVVASVRLSAYQRAVSMKYLDLLISWGDSLYRVDTRETVNQASQLYVMAAELLRDRPVIVKRGIGSATSDKSFAELASLAGTQAEAIETYINVDTSSAKPDSANTPGLPADLYQNRGYFCVPPNAKMLGYWDTVADRLFKIRHSLSLDGTPQQLGLFAPPIDPGLLVKAAAMGLSVADAVGGLSAVSPQTHRFSILIQKANELCGDVRALGSALLTALEKRDAEQLALLRSSHEVGILQLVTGVKELQIEEALHAIDVLGGTRKLAVAKQTYYASRQETIQGEEDHVSSVIGAAVLQGEAQLSEMLAGALAAIPQTKAGWSSWGPHAVFEIGGQQLAAAPQSYGKVLNLVASALSASGTVSSLRAGFRRRKDDWDFQAQQASLEIEHIDRQILAAQIRLDVVTRELANHKQQLANAQSVDDVMRTKFTNDQLYDWMVGQLSFVYRLAYDEALKMARRAEASHQFETADTTTYVQSTYWDSLKKGLLAGEQLQLDLRRLEVASVDKRPREHEMVKHISLAIFAPDQLIEFRRSGVCDIDIPEEWYDLDFPGHYMRRVKSLAVTIPAVVGPYQGIHCKVSLGVGSIVRVNSELRAGAYALGGGDDSRFAQYGPAVNSMVTSSGVNDSGTFDGRDDARYLPFEGAGAIGKFRLELAGASHTHAGSTVGESGNQVEEAMIGFDRSTITDVILHVRYTARDGGDTLRDGAWENLRTVLTGNSDRAFRYVLFSMKSDFATDWNQWAETISASALQPVAKTITVGGGNFRFPERTSAITIAAVTPYSLSSGKLLLSSSTELPVTVVPPSNSVGSWSLTFGTQDAGTIGNKFSNLEDILLVVKYKLAGSI